MDKSQHSSLFPFWLAFRYWLLLGFINFGGPAGQIALMHRDLMERRGWISESRFLHALNFCMLLPGPEAQQLAIYIGWLLHGTRGGIVAGVCFVLPSVFVLLALSYVYAAYGSISIVAGLFAGLKPVVVAIVMEAGFKIGKRALIGPPHLWTAGIAFLAIFIFKIPFPLIVVIAGLVGWRVARARPEIFSSSETKRYGDKHKRELDHSAPQKRITPLHQTSPKRIIFVFLGLWLIPFLALIMLSNPNNLFLQIYLYFTQAAFVTFGGAYAVLAYVSQSAIDTYGWLTHGQMMDGFALAETTPGPLIMVLQFVGFMAGWNHAGNLSQINSAVLAAVVTTYSTFLPCFLFIFLGAPYIEILKGNRDLSEALSTITAAVVGVIMNLAIVLGLSVFWPHGLEGSFNGMALALSIAAFVALYRLRLNILWVLLIGGILGLALPFGD
ncbi:MAG: chromate efflux transporter [Nitrospiraceae bacterium]|nr:chromate efflux transporter [Nitrospira sp.]MCA9455655.1 chromate efflux transporter [Nitrospira sp.]MCB9775310.1 chromate efflux transporter [Nitrospiraceae bacterium]